LRDIFLHCFPTCCVVLLVCLEWWVDSEGIFPSILGHEGGGIVESIGEGVTSCKVLFILLFLWFVLFRSSCLFHALYYFQCFVPFVFSLFLSFFFQRALVVLVDSLSHE
jgi:hypothetical protein